MGRIRIKRKGKWVDPEEVAALREAERISAPAPAVDVPGLPERKDLDPDVPLEQLFFERPEVRAFITRKGQIRSGLTPGQRAAAEQILQKYGDKA